MHSLRFVQFIPISIAECWDFFASPKNLKLITPDHLGFAMPSDDSGPMYAGQIITHTIRPFWNIPFNWVTEITHMQKPHYFIDEQRFGPYKFWHHEHHFNEKSEGVEMSDIIYYRIHCGILGRMLNAVKIKHDLEAIFNYRKQKLCDMFNVKILY